MLDALYPLTDCLLDSLRRVGVRGDVRVRVASHGNNGSDLFIGKLEVLNLICWASDATTTHDLEEVRPLTQLFARIFQTLLHPIHDTTDAICMARTAFIVIMLLAHITVATRLRQGMSRNE